MRRSVLQLPLWDLLRLDCSGSSRPVNVGFWHSRGLQSRWQEVCLVRQCRSMLASRRTAPHDPIPTVSRGRIHTSFDAPRKSTDYVPAPAPRATRFASRFQRERRDAASIDDRQYRFNQRERDVRGSLHTGRDQGGSAPHIAQADTDIDRHCWPNRRSNVGPETGPFCR